MDTIKVGDKVAPAVQKPLIVHFNGQTQRVHWKPGCRSVVEFGNFQIELEFPEGETPVDNLNGPWYWRIVYHVQGWHGSSHIFVKAMDRESAKRIAMQKFSEENRDRIFIEEIVRV